MAAFNIRLAILLRLRHKNAQRNRRRFWVRKNFLMREELGEFRLFMQMHRCDDEMFFRYTRMTPRRFDYLLKLIEPLITHTGPRKPIIPAERLAVTLRFLSTGDSQQSIALSFRLGRSTVCNIIYETCGAIFTALSTIYMKPPDEMEYRRIAEQFWLTWNFPNCCGAIDGKHCVIQAPAASGSEFFNYKRTFSIVLLAIADSNYCFTVIDIGAPGRQSDGGVFKHSKIGEFLEAGLFGLPSDICFPGLQVPSPHVLVGDEAFPLTSYLMRPYPGKQADFHKRIYNYRLSRARRVIENTFGILAARWRIFRRPLIARPERAIAFMKAACVLHNFLRKSDTMGQLASSQYCPSNFVDTEKSDGSYEPGQWRQTVSNDTGLLSIRPAYNRSCMSANDMRQKFVDFFISEAGSLPWQNDYVMRGSRQYV